jgi:hypothetical protein
MRLGGSLRFACLVANAGAGSMRLQPPVQHEPSTTTNNPARGADLSRCIPAFLSLIDAVQQPPGRPK